MPTGEWTFGADSFGTFYMIQPIPEFEPNRVKFGFTTRIECRMSDYRVSSPNVHLLAYWPSKFEWEYDAMAYAACDSKRIGGEIYRLNSVSESIFRAQQFFDQRFSIDSVSEAVHLSYRQWKLQHPVSLLQPYKDREVEIQKNVVGDNPNSVPPTFPELRYLHE